jgi:putative ubiquitin-RnfH superfamily antitoxin RatB of RatAB toxin-antitoxin module
MAVRVVLALPKERQVAALEMADALLTNTAVSFSTMIPCLSTLWYYSHVGT